MSEPMMPFIVGLLACFSAFFRSRYSLGPEIFELRQQVAALKPWFFPGHALVGQGESGDAQ